MCEKQLILNHLNLILDENHEWSVLLGSKNGSCRVFFFTNNYLAVQEAIRLNNSGYNVFFCPNTMSSKPAKGRGEETDITTQNAIVVDIDIEGCDKHASTSKTRYPDSIQTALSFLPLEPSVVVSSGYGIHAYYLLNDTKQLSKETATTFIKALKRTAKRSGFTAKCVDSTFPLNHLFRLAGTKNFKEVNGSIPSNPPICRIISSSNKKYNLEDLIISADSVSPNESNDGLSPSSSIEVAAKRQPKSSKSAEADLAWGIYFFKRIAAERLSYEQWRNAIWIGHAVGVDLSTLDRWSSLDSARYAGTASIEKLISEYKDRGLGIGTLINYLKELEPNDPFTVPLNFKGYAIQLHYFYGNIFKYVEDTNQWILFENGVWNVSDYKSVIKLSKLHINMYDNLMAMNVFQDKNLIKFINAWTDPVIFDKILKIYGGLHMVKSTEFNSHRHLLNVANGVIDLRTGALLPHDPKYYFTYKLDVPYYPLADIMSNSVGLADLNTQASLSDANNPVSSTTTQISDIALGDIYNSLLQIQAFFESILPNEDTRNALLRYLGYCLTGEIKEQKALFIYGKGANGKSVLLNLLGKLLNDFSNFFNSSIFTFNPTDPTKPTTHLKNLKYIRLGMITELSQFNTLQSEQFKRLIGENYLKIRPMYSEEQTITIYFKFILSGNYQMDLTDANDIGVQRRIIQIDFLQDFRKSKDLDIEAKLTTPNSLTALLSLLVEQAKEYYKTGLLESAEMQSAKADYIKSNDFISEFIDEFCIREGMVKCKTFIEQLIENYPKNCESYSYKQLFNLIKNVPGITIKIHYGYRYFNGVSFKSKAISI